MGYHDMKGALQRREFVLHFQPFIALRTGEPLGVEALIRWNHPILGMVEPARFIPEAERSGAILEIGRWVIDEAVRTARELQDAGSPSIVAFNVATAQLSDEGFLDHLDRALSASGADPARLVIEITESAAIADPALARDVIGRCRARGIRVALDDFGTGYSSLRHLLDLTVDIVKIDRSFVRELPEHTQSAMITRALIELSHSLGTTVQAEGVEDARQIVWLQQRGCDLAQGYHISTPLTRAGLEAWLAARDGIYSANVISLSERQLRVSDMLQFDITHRHQPVDKNAFHLSRELLRDVLDVVPAGIALADRYGNVIEQNERFAQFSAPVSAMLSSYSDDFVSVEVELRGKSGQVVRALIRRSIDGSNIILTRADGSHQPKERALGIMLRALHEDRDLYRSAVYALSRSLGWRWIGISRFTGSGAVEVLAWWDGDTFCETFNYELAGTPCERVAEKGHFQGFEQVARLFPQDVALTRIGAQYYGGQVYVGPDGLPMGHVFMLDDRERHDMAAAEEVITLVCELVGAQLRLHASQEATEQAMLVARTDVLTNVRNRTAFQEDVDTLTERYATANVRNALVVSIDLDGTKQINDTRGHGAGDELLRSFCDALRTANRSSDRLYRVGGDEFVLVLVDADLGDAAAVRERIERTIEGLRAAGFPEAGASVGHATLREAGGDVDSALRLADDRMYAEKRGKKRTLRA